MSHRQCRVSFTDVDGIEHTVTVDAESLYEAAVLAAAAFRRQGWATPPQGLAEFRVAVAEPVVEHRVTLQQVRRYLDSANLSPKERLKKERLRDLLGGLR